MFSVVFTAYFYFYPQTYPQTSMALIAWSGPFEPNPDYTRMLKELNLTQSAPWSAKGWSRSGFGADGTTVRPWNADRGPRNAARGPGGLQVIDYIAGKAIGL